MAENLLWPMKLKKPPYLLVNPSAMFNTLDEEKAYRVPLINALVYDGGQPTIRLFRSEINNFTIGLIFDLNKKGKAGFTGFIPFMFQMIGHELVGCRCLGWGTATNDLTSNPDKGMETDPSQLNPSPVLWSHQCSNFVDGDTIPLFAMRGTGLEDEGELIQFNSAGAYSAISYVLTREFITYAINGPFHTMWQDFQGGGQLAIELIIEVQVNARVSSNNGFEVGVLS